MVKDILEKSVCFGFSLNNMYFFFHRKKRGVIKILDFYMTFCNIENKKIREKLVKCGKKLFRNLQIVQWL